MDVSEPPKTALRPMTFEQRVFDQPDGSVIFRQGRTAVAAGVYGPVEVRATKERADCATLEVVFKPKVGTPGCMARAIESLIRGACEAAVLLSANPRSLYTVVIQELHDDGALLACSVNAVCAALLDACAPMRFPFAAAACALDADGEIVVDPDADRCRSATAVGTFVFDGRDCNVVGVSTAGHMAEKKYHVCVDVCRQASREVFGCYREVYSKRSTVM